MFYKKVTENFMALKLPNLCPLVLLVKVTWRQSRALDSEEDKLIGSGLFDYAAEEGSWAFGLSFVGL
jgi:hypothetical protein